MAVERIYEQQTSPQAAAPMPTRSPDEFGASIGAALQGAGQTVHQTQIRAFEIEKRITRDREIADFSHRFSQHRENMDGISREARNQSDPGGAGHSERIRKANEAARATMLDGITDPAVRRMAEQQWDSFSGALYGQESDWAEGQRIAKTLSDSQASFNLSFGRIRRSSDPKVYADEQRLMYEQIGLLNVDPGTRDKLNKFVAQGSAVAYVQNLQDTNPKLARAVLDSGEFDFLEPATLEQLRSGSDVEIRRQEAAAEHKAAQERAQLKEGIATLKQADAQGLVIPDEQWTSAIAAARSMGDESTALELEGLQANSGFARIYESQGPQQREQRLAELRAKRKPSLPEQREIKWLEDHRGSLNERFDTDPVAWAIEHAPAGSGPPPGDITQPGVMQGRVAWARRQAEVYGRPDFPLLTKAEVDQLNAHRQSSTKGELTVLQWMDGLPDDLARRQAARQLAPDDKVFQHLTLVSPRVRETIRRGQQALEANKQWLTPEKENRPKKEMMGAFDRDLAIAMKAFSPADVDAVRTIGRQFTVGIHSARGETINQLEPGVYGMGQRVALGGAVRNGQAQGGLSRWGDVPFVLPSNQALSGFASAVARDIETRKRFPANPDGSVAVLRMLHPVLIGTTIEGGKEIWLYRWEDRGGRVVQQNGGGDFISRIENR